MRALTLRHQAQPWLLLALTALGGSALLAVLLVLSRTPGLAGHFGLAANFHTALVLHVNFAVVVWLLTCAATLWVGHQRRDHPRTNGIALLLTAGGTVMMALTPLLGGARPVMSNYIPVLDAPLFLAGLATLFAGVALTAGRFLLDLRRSGAAPNALERLLQLAALTLFTALALFAISAARLGGIAGDHHFEQLFWGGGHLLQFLYLLLLGAAWQHLAGAGRSRPLPLALGLAPLLAALALALLFAPDSDASRRGFTLLMQLGTPLLIVPLGLDLLRRRPLAAPLRLSLGLLLFGLLLGLAIRADNVMVTAHYHATNAAITLALMALAYRLLPQLGLGQPGARSRQWQLRLYAGGMGLYICGMAASGLVDVPRKVPYSGGGEFQAETLALAVMGSGGAIAILATLLFLLLAAATIGLRHRSPAGTLRRT